MPMVARSPARIVVICGLVLGCILLLRGENAKLLKQSLAGTNAIVHRLPDVDVRQNEDRIALLNDTHPGHPAAQAVWNRYETYRLAGDADRWRMRGLGYLFSELNMVLSARYMYEERPKRQHVVRIENVLSTHGSSDCALLTLWVRVNGPEIFAGKPQAVVQEDSCWWEFPFSPEKHGEFTIEVKLLTWNGGASIVGHPDNKKTPKLANVQCPITAGGPEDVATNEPNATHSSVRAFKLYEPIHGCCEFCTRQRPRCVAWATPPSNFDATFVNNGCEFYYAAGQEPPFQSKHINRRRLDVQRYHGIPHTNKDVSYFMGCGWSTWFTLDVPCVSGALDDRVHVATPSFVITKPTERENRRRVQSNRLPLCTMEHEQFSTEPTGRWVRRAFPNATECPQPMLTDAPFSSKFTIKQFDPQRPHCWHRDDFSIIGEKCLEMNCRLIPRDSIWKSAVHNETHIYTVWKPYACDYIELTEPQLQTCVNTLRISKIDRNGQSVAEFLNEYLTQRLQNITMVEEDDTTTTATLSTLAMLHKMGQPDDTFLQHTDFSLLGEQQTNHKVFWVSGFFLSSERGVHTHVDRMDWANRRVMQQYPQSNLLNAFELSAAFTYDTATQMDGMHIIGPPMKMVITKLFHHLCKDVVPDARRVGEGW